MHFAGENAPDFLPQECSPGRWYGCSPFWCLFKIQYLMIFEIWLEVTFMDCWRHGDLSSSGCFSMVRHLALKTITCSDIYFLSHWGFMKSWALSNVSNFVPDAFFLYLFVLWNPNEKYFEGSCYSPKSRIQDPQSSSHAFKRGCGEPQFSRTLPCGYSRAGSEAAGVPAPLAGRGLGKLPAAVPQLWESELRSWEEVSKPSHRRRRQTLARPARKSVWVPTF